LINFASERPAISSNNKKQENSLFKSERISNNKSPIPAGYEFEVG